jgi:AraC family transcriptional regulator
MDQAIEQAVTRAIEAMRSNLGEQLTIDDMARTAMFSKFYFCRIFRQATGVSPRRFLSALRLQEAKRLLLTTDWSVAEISNRVGYTSLGTFSSRFKHCVCVSPTTYRQFGGVPPRPAPGTCRGPAGTAPVTLQGEILPPPGADAGLIFAGLFPDRIPQGAPVRCTILSAPGPYVLRDVPDGEWHLLVQAFTPGNAGYGHLGDAEQTLFVAAHGPITIAHEMVIPAIRLQLRPMRALDPPVLVALPDLRAPALVSTAS